MLAGRVVAVYGRHYLVSVGQQIYKAKPAIRELQAYCGDWVNTRADSEPGTLLMTELLPRRSLLKRESSSRSKPFAANVDQVLVMLAVQPEFSLPWLHRALACVQAEGLEVVVLLNKAELDVDASQAAKLALLDDLQVPWLTLSLKGQTEQARQTLLSLCQGKSSILLGRSGVGKSTLVNLLVPDAAALTNTISLALNSGKHTTTATKLYALDEQSSLMDSPGFEQFGLNHLSSSQLQHAFAEIQRLSVDCRFTNCTHQHEPGCRVLQALAAAQIHPSRYETFCSLWHELQAGLALAKRPQFS